MRLQKYIDIGAAIAEDCSQHKTTGYTYSNIDTYMNSPYGRLVYLDGANYVESTVLTSFVQQTGVFTISFRAKRDATTNTDWTIMALGVDGSAQTQGFLIYFNSADYIYMTTYVNNSSTFGGGLPITVEDSTDWNTYTIVGDGSTLKLYINGTARGQFDTIAGGDLGGEQVQPIRIGNSTSGMTGLVSDVVICDWAWETTEIDAFVSGTLFDFEKDINAYWPLDNIDHIADHSFKALNSDPSHGFDPTPIGTYKSYPYFAGTAATYYSVPVALASSTLAIEFDCIIDSSDTFGQLIALTNTTNIAYWDTNGTAVGVNLGTPDVFVDGIQIVGCTNDQLHDAIVDGTRHNVRFENINGHIQFTSANSCCFYGNPSSGIGAGATGFLFNVGIDLTNDGSFDHFYPLDEANGLADTVGTADLVAHGTTVNWVETSIASLQETINDRLSSKALVFSGSEYMTLPSSAATSLNGLSSITFSTWIKNESGGTLLSLWNDAEEKLQISINSSGTITVLVTTTDGGGTSSITSGLIAVDSYWRHLAVVLDFANNVCRFFVDGSEDPTSHTIDRDSSFVSGGATSYLFSTGSSNNFVGTVADMRIYEKALNLSEIKDIGKKSLNGIPFNFGYALVSTGSSRVSTSKGALAAEDWSIRFKINSNDGSAQAIMGTTLGNRTKIYYFPSSDTIRVESAARAYWDTSGCSEGVWFTVTKTDGKITLYEEGVEKSSDTNSAWNTDNGQNWWLFSVDGYDLSAASISDFYIEGRANYEAVPDGQYGTGAGSPASGNQFWDTVTGTYKGVTGSALGIEIA